MFFSASRSEKKTFYSFVALYIFSSVLFLSIIGVMFYHAKYKLIRTMSEASMQSFASALSADIVSTHMRGDGLGDLSLDDIMEYDFVLYDKSNNKIYGNINPTIDISNGIYEYNDTLIYISSNTFEHLGVSHILVLDEMFDTQVNRAKSYILFIFLLLFFIVCLVGVVLGYIFILPIKNQRLKIDRFIKNATHELNTPISALLLASSMKLDSKNIERIKLSAKRVSQIYQNLTFVSFAQEDMEEIVFYDISQLLQEECKYFEILANKKIIKLHINIEVTKLKIAKEDFIRLINNLISNAIKYTPANKNIYIKLTKTYLQIKDEGIGIDKEYQKDIFARYFRVENSVGGFGIGLDIVRDILNKYDFKLDLDSQKGVGTNIKIIW